MLSIHTEQVWILCQDQKKIMNWPYTNLLHRKKLVWFCNVGNMDIEMSKQNQEGAQIQLYSMFLSLWLPLLQMSSHGNYSAKCQKYLRNLIQWKLEHSKIGEKPRRRCSALIQTISILSNRLWYHVYSYNSFVPSKPIEKKNAVKCLMTWDKWHHVYRLNELCLKY